MSHLSVIDSLVLGFGFSPGPAEMMVLAVVALLLYGGSLPEVARTWGKTLSEFRRSLSGIQSEINDVIYSEPEQIEYRDDAHVPQGYVESDYVEPECVEPESDAEEAYDSEKTDGSASEDTIVEKKTTE